jgi:hypothetical protein
MRPVAIGTAGTGLDADNRIYRAYQGITYTIHADAVGGSWPYTYSLSNAPSGMTIEAGPCTTIGPTCTAGTITWVNPQATASNITVRITDKDGDYVEGTWSVTVSTTAPGTDGFCFINASTGNDSGSGTLNSPWQTLAKAQASCGQSSILYLRGGTYATAGSYSNPVEEDGGSAGYHHKIAFGETIAPVIWIGYPGETAIIDFGATGANEVEMFDFTGKNIWIDNLTIRNIGNIGWRLAITSRFGAVVRNITAEDLLDGYDGGNSAFFFWQGVSPPSYYDTVQSSAFSGMSTLSCAIKWYGSAWSLSETSTFEHTVGAEAVIALKNAMANFTVRANIAESNVRTLMGGNLNTGSGGEFYHNLSKGSGTSGGEGHVSFVASLINPPEEIWVYRNTFVGGRMYIKQNINSSNDGPYNFNDNVIVMAAGTGGSCPDRFTCHCESCPGGFQYSYLVVDADNVEGANDSSIADATTGELVGASRTTYLGIAGYELGDSVSRRFSPRLNLIRSSLPQHTEEMN